MALELAGRLTVFWGRRGYGNEGRQWLNTALMRVEALPALEGSAAQRRLVARTIGWLGLGSLANAQGETAFARAKIEAALALARQTGDEFLIASTLTQLGTTILYADDFQGAETALTESLVLLRRLGERRRIALVLIQLAAATGFLGKREASRNYIEESIRLSRGVYMAWDSALSFLVLGQIMRAQGDTLEARTQLREAQAVFLEMGDKFFFNVAQSEFAETARLEGNTVEAAPLYKKTIVIWRELGHRGGLARCLEVLAFIANSQTPSSTGESSAYLKRAARLLGAAEALREASQSEMTPEEQTEYDREATALRAKLDPATFNAAWAEGRAMTIEQTIEFAISDF
jgi:tetratricopeptide (TPR) repeat protein